MVVLSDNVAADILFAVVGLFCMSEIIDEVEWAFTRVVGGVVALYEQLIRDIGAQTPLHSDHCSRQQRQCEFDVHLRLRSNQRHQRGQ